MTTRIIEPMNMAEAMASWRDTALRILAERSGWFWLLPWNVFTWFYLRRVVRDCARLIIALGREDLL